MGPVLNMKTPPFLCPMLGPNFKTSVVLKRHGKAAKACREVHAIGRLSRLTLRLDPVKHFGLVRLALVISGQTSLRLHVNMEEGAALYVPALG